MCSSCASLAEKMSMFSRASCESTRVSTALSHSANGFANEIILESCNASKLRPDIRARFAFGTQAGLSRFLVGDELRQLVRLVLVEPRLVADGVEQRGHVLGSPPACHPHGERA